MVRRHIRPWPYAALVAVSFAGASVAAATAAERDDYEIRLDRPSKVGETFEFESLAARRSHVVYTIGDAAPEVKDESVGVRVEGVIEVLGVGPKGQTTKLSCKLDACTTTAGKEKPKQLFP